MRVFHGRCVLIFGLVTLLCSSGYAQQCKVTVVVKDFDTGNVLTNALAGLSVDTNIKPGWGWGGGRPNRYQGYTDTNGVCVLKGEGNGGTASVYVKKEGYYGSSGYRVGITNVTGIVGMRKWQPWNPTVNVALKQIGKPIPLYAKRLREIEMPVENEPVGFDLVEGDWVSPHGEGKNPDIVFQMDRKPEQVIEKTSPHGPYSKTLFDVTLTVHGSNDGDGFHLVPMLPIGHGPASGLRMPREAPVDGYEPTITKRAYNSVAEPLHTDVRDDANYFFRVRTEKDEDGKIVSALYGKITGDFRFEPHVRKKVSFTYYINPTPNDRNLEFDPKKNLFKNLSSQEEVREP